MPMLNKKRKAVTAAEKSTSTHGGNGENVTIEEQSEFDLENNMSVDQLLDPEDFTGGSTYTSITAGTKGKPVKAAETTNVGTIDNDIDPANGYLENAAELEEDDDEISDEEIMAAFGGPGEDQGLENNNAPQTLEAAEGDGDDDDWDPQPQGDAGVADDTAEVSFDADQDIETDAEGDIEDEV